MLIMSKDLPEQTTKSAKKQLLDLKQRPEQFQSSLSASGDECYCNSAAQNVNRKCADTCNGADERSRESSAHEHKRRNKVRARGEKLTHEPSTTGCASPSNTTDEAANWLLCSAERLCFEAASM